MLANTRQLALLGFLAAAACGDVVNPGTVDAGGGGDGGQCTVTEGEVCAANNVECGAATLTDMCGETREIASCGLCETALFECDQGSCVAPAPLDWRNPANLEDVVVAPNTLAFSMALTPSGKLYFTDGNTISVLDLAGGGITPVVENLPGTFWLFADGERIFFTDNGGDNRAPVGSIKVFDPAADPPVSEIVGEIVDPSTVVLDAAGNIYVRNRDFDNGDNTTVWVVENGSLTPIRSNLAIDQGRFGSGLWIEASGDILLPDSGPTSPGDGGLMLRLAADGSTVTPIATALPTPSFTVTDANGDIVFRGLLDEDASTNPPTPRGGLYVLPATDPSTPQQIVERHVFGVAHGDGEIFYATGRADPNEIRVIRNL